MGSDIGKAAASTSTALVDASNDLLSGNAIGSRSVFANEDGISETVFSSVFGASTTEAGGPAANEPAATTVVEKDLSQVRFHMFSSLD